MWDPPTIHSTRSRSMIPDKGKVAVFTATSWLQTDTFRFRIRRFVGTERDREVEGAFILMDRELALTLNCEEVDFSLFVEGHERWCGVDFLQGDWFRDITVIANQLESAITVVTLLPLSSL